MSVRPAQGAAERVPMCRQSEGGETANGTRSRNFGGFAACCALRTRLSSIARQCGLYRFCFGPALTAFVFFPVVCLALAVFVPTLFFSALFAGSVNP